MRQPSQATATAASNRVHTGAVIRLSPVVYRNGLPFEWRERCADRVGAFKVGAAAQAPGRSWKAQLGTFQPRKSLCSHPEQHGSYRHYDLYLTVRYDISFPTLRRSLFVFLIFLNPLIEIQILLPSPKTIVNQPCRLTSHKATTLV